MAEKSEYGSVSNLSTKVQARAALLAGGASDARRAAREGPQVLHGQRPDPGGLDGRGRGAGAAHATARLLAQQTAREVAESGRRPSGAACAKGQHTDRLQNPAKLRRFRIGGRIGGG